MRLAYYCNMTISLFGEYFDKETGNIYLRARYYDPGLGRFISEDPIRDGLNWYVYCGGNPIKFVDPLGLKLKLNDPTDQELRNALEEITDHNLTINEETGEVTISKEERGRVDVTTTKHRAGTMLILRIINNDEMICIEQIMEGKSNFNSGKIQINFNETGPIYLYNGNGSTKVDLTSQPVFITVAHELVHADHWLRGTHLDKFNRTLYTVKNLDGRDFDSSVSKEELNTVGPIEWEEQTGRRYRRLFIDDLTENDIRWEHGLPLRSGY